MNYWNTVRKLYLQALIHYCLLRHNDLATLDQDATFRIQTAVLLQEAELLVKISPEPPNYPAYRDLERFVENSGMIERDSLAFTSDLQHIIRDLVLQAEDAPRFFAVMLSPHSIDFYDPRNVEHIRQVEARLDPMRTGVQNMRWFVVDELSETYHNGTFREVSGQEALTWLVDRLPLDAYLTAYQQAQFVREQWLYNDYEIAQADDLRKQAETFGRMAMEFIQNYSTAHTSASPKEQGGTSDAEERGSAPN